MRSIELPGIVSTAAGIIALVLASGVSQPAAATFVQYNSRATFDALGPYVPVDWGVFGPAGTGISTPDFRTVDGITIGVASSEGVLSRHDEGTDFTGTFAVGDHLLTDAGSLSDTFVVSFASPVRGFGTQIDIHSRSGLYSGFVDIFSPANVLLYKALFSGNNTLAEDNSAPFVGVASNLANIGYAMFFIDQPGFFPDASGDLGINRLDVLVPEPATITLFLPVIVGVVGFGFLRRKTNGRHF